MNPFLVSRGRLRDGERQPAGEGVGFFEGYGDIDPVRPSRWRIRGHLDEIIAARGPIAGYARQCDAAEPGNRVLDDVLVEPGDHGRFPLLFFLDVRFVYPDAVLIVPMIEDDVVILFAVLLC